MNKQTKRIRRNKKNKTRKYYGGAVEVTEKSKGVFDVIGDKLSGYSGKALDYVKNKSLRLVGLQPIKEPEAEQITTTQDVDEKINLINVAKTNKNTLNNVIVSKGGIMNVNINPPKFGSKLMNKLTKFK